MWSENQKAVDVYHACFSQWRHAPSGLVLGLDYSGIEAIMRINNVEHFDDTFERLQILERETVAVSIKKQRNNGQQN